MDIPYHAICYSATISQLGTFGRQDFWRASLSSLAEAVQRFQQEVIPHVFERGGAYMAIREPKRASRLASVLKVLPGEEVHPRFAGMAGVAEIITAPHRQRHQYGASLLHAYFSRYAVQDAPAMLDAFEGSGRDSTRYFVCTNQLSLQTLFRYDIIY